ncbi:hypothetical protein [Noviherbaspirillum agri]
MDLLDLFLAVATGAVVVAALLFPINRDGRGGDDPRDHQKRAPEDVEENSKKKDGSGSE